MGEEESTPSLPTILRTNEGEEEHVVVHLSTLGCWDVEHFCLGHVVERGCEIGGRVHSSHLGSSTLLHRHPFMHNSPT